MGNRVLLAVLSAAITLLVMEVAYRCVLLHGLSVKLAKPTFQVMSQSIYEFDEAFGYRYLPGSTATNCEVVNGLPSRVVTVTVNLLGGIGSVPADNSPVKVLAFGDSFTANPLQPVAWPEFLSEAAEFDVLNLGRDGYGILQMMHLAAEKSRELKPDLIIVAFIVEDLVRDRFWRSTVVEDGHSTIFISTVPDPRPDPASAAELALVDASVTPEWLHALPAGTPERDPGFHRICDRFRRTARAFYLSRIFDPRLSLLMNRLRYGDAYYGLYPQARHPRTPLQSYAADPTVAADVKSLRVPILMVLLPMCHEIKAGHYFMDAQAAALLQSLEALTGTQTIRLLDYMELGGSNPESLFLLPEDQHPSPAGAAAYANAMVRMLNERVTFTGGRPRPDEQPPDLAAPSDQQERSIR